MLADTREVYPDALTSFAEWASANTPAEEL